VSDAWTPRAANAVPFQNRAIAAALQARDRHALHLVGRADLVADRRAAT
jgi:hypothetical protein